MPMSVAELIKPQDTGPKAPPAIPIINSAEPVLVNLPMPDKASGHTAGQTIALAKPRKAIINNVSGSATPPKGTNTILAIA